MKRYDMIVERLADTGMTAMMAEKKLGKWVKYEDVQQLTEGEAMRTYTETDNSVTKRHIRWVATKSPNVIAGTYSLSDHNLVACEVEHWVHSLHGDVYEPIYICRTWAANGLIVKQTKRIRIEGDDIPYMIHSQEEAMKVCEDHLNNLYNRSNEL